MEERTLGMAGVDETGRGSCFGPVICCAVVFPVDGIPEVLRDRLGDSKEISAPRRKDIARELSRHVAYAFGAASAREIDRLNPRVGTLLAMRRAVLRLPGRPSQAVIDGRDIPDGLPCQAEAIVRGDASVPEISAASILAKVFRDHLVTRLAPLYPEYGLERHAGYGTKAHFQAIQEKGPTPHHRRSFLRKLLGSEIENQSLEVELLPGGTR